MGVDPNPIDCEAEIFRESPFARSASVRLGVRGVRSPAGLGALLVEDPPLGGKVTGTEALTAAEADANVGTVVGVGCHARGGPWVW
mmetsp:Transcript_76881/g.89328  ORF Transcript_76881/g.89328 Transcript_76881/m.89328 type:complete len:86 (-) Transcript_76881:499-756(-)